MLIPSTAWRQPLTAGSCSVGQSNTSISIDLEALTNRLSGADSRTTTGAYIANRVTDKLTQVHDTIWCCRYGVNNRWLASKG